MRYLIKFTKEADIKFISHLDLLRTMQRIVAKSNIDISYSKGFNPHMATSFAQPLSVGVYSKGDYLDMELDSEMDEKELIDRLNEVSTDTIRFLSAKKIPKPLPNEKKFPPAMALIDAAKYTIYLKYSNAEKLEDEMETMIKKPEWVTIKKTKKGEKEADIKALVHKFDYKIENNNLVISTVISCGSRENLSADLLASYIKNNTSNHIEGSFIEIRREEMYTLKDNKLVELYKI